MPKTKSVPRPSATMDYKAAYEDVQRIREQLERQNRALRHELETLRRRAEATVVHVTAAVDRFQELASMFDVPRTRD